MYFGLTNVFSSPRAPCLGAFTLASTATLSMLPKLDCPTPNPQLRGRILPMTSSRLDRMEPSSEAATTVNRFLNSAKMDTITSTTAQGESGWAEGATLSAGARGKLSARAIAYVGWSSSGPENWRTLRVGAHHVGSEEGKGFNTINLTSYRTAHQGAWV